MRAGGGGWRADAVAALLDVVPDGELRFFAGTSEEQIEMPFEYRVLLTVPRDEIVRRLRTRASNAYGRTRAERVQVLADRERVEPLLRALRRPGPVHGRARGRGRGSPLARVTDRAGGVA